MTHGDLSDKGGAWPKSGQKKLKIMAVSDHEQETIGILSLNIFRFGQNAVWES